MRHRSDLNDIVSKLLHHSTMARTKADAMRQTARKSQHDPFEHFEYDSDEDEDMSDDDDGPVDTYGDGPPPRRDDGWALAGDWAITTNDKQYSNSCGPFIWSFYRAAGVSYMSFDVGFLKGIAKLDKSLYDILPPRRNKTTFTWRGRETGEGQMEIDDSSQTGELTFKQQEGGFMVLSGSLRGSYCGSDGLRFIGSRVKASPSHTGQSWSSYNARAYEQERVGRWR